MCRHVLSWYDGQALWDGCDGPGGVGEEDEMREPLLLLGVLICTSH